LRYDLQLLETSRGKHFQKKHLKVIFCVWNVSKLLNKFSFHRKLKYCIQGIYFKKTGNTSWYLVRFAIKIVTVSSHFLTCLSHS
jgi:hypothetical protein